MRFFWLLGGLSLLLLGCNGSDPRPGSASRSVDAPTLDTGRPGITEDYTNTNRDIWQKPDVILNLLGNLEDKVVADIGAGTGFFSFRLAPEVRKVIAIDINPAFLTYLDSVKVLELAADTRDRLETRLAAADSPNLKPNEVDIIVIANTLAYIPNQVAYLRGLKEALRPGGRILIVDFKRKRLPEGIGPPPDIRLPLYRTEELLTEAGYPNYRSIDGALDYQYVVIAERD